MAQRIVYWFRNDLRLNDNEALFSAAKTAQEIVPVYIFDPRQFEPTKLGFRRTGAIRAQFLIECVSDLRSRLRAKGSDLLIRVGEPEKIIPQLAETYNADYIYTSKEIAPEETRIESSLSKKLKVGNVDIKLFWMDTVTHVSDLPFPVSKLPLGFDNFREMIQSQSNIKTPIGEPEKISLPGDYEAGVLPSLPMLGIDPLEVPNAGEHAGSKLKGGETTAIERLEQYASELEANPSERISKDSLTDSKLTIWLSVGCLSPGSIYQMITTRIKDSALKNALISNLLARDYFHWTLLRYGPRLFKPSGIKHTFNQHWNNDSVLFEKWKNGETDNAEVNKAIHKLTKTGDLAYAERDLVAGYLVHTLQLNWTWGAMYLESFLLDYDVSVNWGRWNNLAGVGPD